MHTNNKCVSPFAHTERFGIQPSNPMVFYRGPGPVLFVFGIALMLIAASIGQTWAAEQPNIDRAAQLDSRWLPWIGSWRLISNTVATAESNADNDYILEINPGDNRRAVVMKGSQDETVLLDKQITVDGSRHELKEEGCGGLYRYSWSDTGRRLLFESELNCSDDRSRTISGISFFIDPIEWVDIQLVTSGEDRAITIRRYRAAAGMHIAPGISSAGHIARLTADSNFSIDEIVELTSKVDPQVVEAALVEMHKPFDINAKTLVHLADAGVPSQVVDLVVALSFPEKFSVERYDAEPVQSVDIRQPDANVVYCHACAPFGMWSFYDPFYPWYWRSPGWFYGYWGWGGGWGYYPPIWYPPSGGYSISGGRLIAGQGYAKVSPGGSNAPPRYAQPRSNTRKNSRGYSSGSNSAPAAASRNSRSSRSGSLSNPSYSPPSRGGISGRSGGGGGYSGGGSPRASPGGYSGGGGGQAHRRD